MRTMLLTGLLLLTASAAGASPFVFSQNQRLNLTSQDGLTALYALARAKDDAILLGDGGAHSHYTPSQSEFGIGPIRADGTDADGLGRRHGPRPRYRLDGVDVLGGSIGGSVDGRGAMLNLHWNGND